MVDIDIERLASRSKPSGQQKQGKDKDTLTYQVGYICKPSVVIDRHGRILVLYIPSFLDQHSLVSARLL